MQRQERKSHSRVSKLEQAKTTVIANKQRRDEVKQRRLEQLVVQQVEREVKKIRVQEAKVAADPAVKRVKIDISNKKAMDGVTLRNKQMQWRSQIEQ